MDQNNSSTSSSSNVDTLLNDILQGKAPTISGSSSMTSDAGVSALPVAPAPMPTVSPVAAPMSVPATDVPSGVDPVVTPFASAPLATAPAPTVAFPVASGAEITALPPQPAPMMGHGMAALSSAPLSPSAPADSAVAPSLVPAQTSVVPLSTATVPGAVPPTAEMPKYQAATMPQVKKRAPLIAGAVVGAVVLAGVGAGLVLSGQDQDVRNQAYVAPKTTTQQNTQVQPSGTSASVGMNIVVEPTAENNFLMMKTTYPQAQMVSLSGGSVAGSLYTATIEATGKQTYFAQINGLQTSEATSPIAWLELDDGTFYQVGEIEMNSSGVGHLLFDNITEKTPKAFVISYEPSDVLAGVGVTTEPTEKVINAAL